MDNFIGEIRLFPYNNIPSEWVICSGQELKIQQNIALYSLIGNQFGGNTKTTFNLPNLNGRTIIGTNYNKADLSLYKVGDSGGLESVVLNEAQMPAHNHSFKCSDSYTTTNPTNAYLSNSLKTQNPESSKNLGTVLLYKEYQKEKVLTPLNSRSVNAAGGNIGHENRMKFQALVYCIAIKGFFPPRSDS